MLIVNRRIGRPLRNLPRAVGATGSRLASALGAIDGPAEIEELAMKFQAVIADRDTYELQLSHQALHDPLTGLANRALLVERLNDALERARRQRVVGAQTNQLVTPRNPAWARFRHSQACSRAQGVCLGAIPASSGVFPRPSMLTGRDFGTPRRAFAPVAPDPHAGTAVTTTLLR